MSGFVVPEFYPALPAQRSAPGVSLPVAIDYPAALALRQMALVHDELPKYLLAPEISALLHYVPDLHRKLLLATLWNSGARINEALALTRENFSLAPPYPFVQLATLKQRAEKATRSAGRLPTASTPLRVVPLSDPQYVAQLQTMVATLKIPLAPQRAHRPDGKGAAVDHHRSDGAQLAGGGGGCRGARRGDVLGARHPAHLPPQLRDAHAVCRHSAQGAAGADGAQIDQFDGGLHQSLCAGCGSPAPGAIPDTGGRGGGDA